MLQIRGSIWFVPNVPIQMLYYFSFNLPKKYINGCFPSLVCKKGLVDVNIISFKRCFLDLINTSIVLGKLKLLMVLKKV